MAAAVAMVATGWLYGLAFPPLALRWLAWVALVPVIVTVRMGSGAPLPSSPGRDADGDREHPLRAGGPDRRP